MLFPIFKFNTERNVLAPIDGTQILGSIHIMRYALIFIAAIFLSFTARADPLDWANGAWGIDIENMPEGLIDEEVDAYRNCKSTPVFITVNRKAMRYKAVHSGEDNFVSTSPILTATTSTLSLQYDDEDRVMENGNLHKWHMVFVSPDKFYWVLGEGITEDERDGVIAVARVRCRMAVG